MPQYMNVIIVSKADTKNRLSYFEHFKHNVLLYYSSLCACVCYVTL